MASAIISITTAAVTGVTWCLCTATASLLASCCGNDKPSTVPPSLTSGRRRSVFLLILSISLAFGFQYGVAPALQPDGSAVTDLPRAGEYLVDAWTDGCLGYDSKDLQEQCSGNAGVYRAAGAATLFFILAGLAALCKPTANREAWPAKYVLFLALATATVFIPNKPLFSDIYMQLARVGGVVFILFQQIILIDLAYNWNESWVAKSDEAEAEEVGSGKKWLGAILASCAILFIGSLTVIVLMFVYFSGCPSNEAFISITLAMSIVVTAAQMSGENASLLTSGVIVSYATYLCLTAVSKNPNGECNPKLGDEDVLGIVLGIGFTLMSLGWTGWSLTAESRVQGGSNPMSNALVDDDHGEETTGEPNQVKGVVTNQDYGTRGSTDEEAGDLGAALDDVDETETNRKAFSNSWKLNVILGLVCCWFSMALTGWGAIEAGGNAANPDVSNVSMWMIIASQWTALLLYLWTLIAPWLFPDRDFS